MVRSIPQLGKDGRIIEGLVTTLHADGSINISPMGPIVDVNFSTFILRPFQTSTTYSNLFRTKEAVFHVTDDVALIAQAALGTPSPLPGTFAATQIAGQVLQDACRWYALTVHEIDISSERSVMVAECVEKGHLREFVGFNRAQHAVLEAAILATRVPFLEPEFLLSELERLESPVRKTGSSHECHTFEFLRKHIQALVAQQTAQKGCVLP